MKKTKTEAVVATSHVQRGQKARLAVELRGDVLLVHQWTLKAVLEMICKQRGTPLPQEDRDIAAEGEASAYPVLGKPSRAKAADKTALAKRPEKDRQMPQLLGG